MPIQKPRLMSALLLSAALSASAASQLTTSERESLIESDGIPRTSAGVGLELQTREISADGGGEGSLESTAYYGYLGYDLRPWLTLFGTAGAVEADEVGGGVGTGEFDSDLRWSLGVNANLWHVDLSRPDYLRGRLSFAVQAEYIANESSADTADAEWSEIRVSLPLGFEIPNEPMSFWGVHSLFLFAGPVYSTLDGDISSGGRAVDFEESGDMGAIFGGDIYAAPNLSLGAHLLYVDDASTVISLRYHF